MYCFSLFFLFFFRFVLCSLLLFRLWCDCDVRCMAAIADAATGSVGLLVINISPQSSLRVSACSGNACCVRAGYDTKHTMSTHAQFRFCLYYALHYIIILYTIYTRIYMLWCSLCACYVVSYKHFIFVFFTIILWQTMFMGYNCILMISLSQLLCVFFFRL